MSVPSAILMQSYQDRLLMESLDRLSGQIADMTASINHYMEIMREQNELLNIMVSAGLPSSAYNTRAVQVTNVAPVLLYENMTEKAKRIRITNDDPAQPLWIGQNNVNVNIGEIVTARNQTIQVLPSGSRIYGICFVAFISVRISECYDIAAEIKNVWTL